ncbi:MAG: ComEC/Rec2 family competence protein [Pseudanabaenaceae cyanobacterium bins.68]|nr:ComEC/Rec2 family competence protein [Pseudanabaenaceae cyanobacterium bins.68]
MTSAAWLLLCIAFIGGGFAQNWWERLVLLFLVAIAALVTGLAGRRSGSATPKWWLWLLMAALATASSLYLEWRIPIEQSTDIARFAPLARAVVTGKVTSNVTTTRSGRAKFNLEVTKLKSAPDRQVTGSLYVTVALPQATGLRPGQELELRGSLYRPSAAKNPGGFDFKAYLGRQGIFAGLTAQQVKFIGDPPRFGGWWIRQRMAEAHVLGAGVPHGSLLSALILGNRAVDLPNDVKDTFVRVGLAAALAASGFQVSLILGSVLLVCRSLSPWQQFGIGMAALCLFLLLTGVSPSVLRAVVMGTGTLVGGVIGRKSRPILGLAIAAVILLIYQPLWLYDLGFQFSFLATLGLLVAATPIQEYFSFLPPILAAALSIPIAAYVWTLPLQLFVFGKVSPYSILANVLTTPLVSFATIGGVISGILGVIFVPLGALATWLLFFALVLIIAIARMIESLPGAVSSLGTIALWQLLIAYGLLVGVAAIPGLQRQRRWIPVMAAMIIILFVPGIVERQQLSRLTILAIEDLPLMLIQDQGKNILINSGKRQTAEFTVLPLLQREGINQLDLAIATGSQITDGWQRISQQGIKIQRLVLSPNTKLSAANRELEQRGTEISPLNQAEVLNPSANFAVELISKTPTAIAITTGSSRWLFLDHADLQAQNQLLQQPGLLTKLPAQYLWSNNLELSSRLLQVVKPEALISSRTNLPEPLLDRLQSANVRLYWTARDGALEWSAATQLRSLREAEDTASPLGF